MNIKKHNTTIPAFLLTLKLFISYLSNTLNLNENFRFLLYLLSYLLPILLYITFWRCETQNRIYIRSFPPLKSLLLYFFAAIFVVLTFSFVQSWFNLLLPPSNIKNITLIENSSFSSFAYALFRHSALPALLEESLCRYAVLSLLLPYGKLPAAIVSGVLFAFMHTNAEQIIYTAAAGIVIGVFVAKERSLTLGIFLHMGINFLSLYFVYLEIIFPPRVFTLLSRFLALVLLILGAVALFVLFLRLNLKSLPQVWHDTRRKIKIAGKLLFSSFIVGYILFTLIIILLNFI